MPLSCLLAGIDSPLQGALSRALTLNLGPDEVDNLVYYFSKLLLRFGDEWNEMVMLVVRL